MNAAELRRRWNEARDGSQPTHAAMLGLEAVVQYLEANEPTSDTVQLPSIPEPDFGTSIPADNTSSTVVNTEANLESSETA